MQSRTKAIRQLITPPHSSSTRTKASSKLPINRGSVRTRSTRSNRWRTGRPATRTNSSIRTHSNNMDRLATRTNSSTPTYSNNMDRPATRTSSSIRTWNSSTAKPATRTNSSMRISSIKPASSGCRGRWVMRRRKRKQRASSRLGGKGWARWATRWVISGRHNRTCICNARPRSTKSEPNNSKPGQQALDAAYQNFVNQRDYPKSQLNFYSGILHGVPVSANSDVQTTTPAPSTLGQLAGLGIAGAGAYNAYSSAQAPATGG